MGIWDRFDDIASADEVEEAKSKFTPPEAGEYEVTLEALEPSESSKGSPMLKGQFKSTEDGKMFYYNQVLQNINNPDMTAVNISEAVNFVSALIGEEIVFSGLTDLSKKIASLELGKTYRIKISYGNKDTECRFPKFKCLGEASELPFDN